MAPIDVDPVALAAGGTALVRDGDALAAALTAFSGSLTGFNAGQDTAGVVFGQSYLTNATAVIKAAGAALAACRQVGFGIQASAANYSAAEATATVGAPAPSVPPPMQPCAAPVSVTIPSPFGEGIAAPMLWSLVEFFVGDFWPNGDPGAIRAAAGAWKTLGETLGRIGAQIPMVTPSVSAQLIPEQSKITSAIGDIASSVTKLAGMCSTIATSLEGFADEVQQAQDAIRDLLKRLSPSGLLDTIGDLFSGHSPLDDIKAVARDIMAVLRNFGREAEAKVDALTMAVAELDGMADAVENWVSKHFPAMAPLINGAIDFEVGVWKNIIGLVESVAALNPERFLYNPQGALQTWKGTAEGLALLTNPALLGAKIAADPHGALEMGKGLIDWDDVKSGHPMRAVGYTTATVASFFVPGGAAAKPAALGAQAGVRAAEGAAVEARAGSALTRDAAAAAGRLPAADIATQTAKITEKLDNLPQIRPAEPAPPGVGQSRPGAALSEQPHSTNTGLPSAEPRAHPPAAATEAHPAGVPATEARPGPVEAPPGHPTGSTPATGEHPTGAGAVDHTGNPIPHEHPTGEAPVGMDGSVEQSVPQPGSTPTVEGHDYGFSPQNAFEHVQNPADEIARLNDGGVPTRVTDGYDPLAGRTIEEFEREFTVPGKDGNPRWDWQTQAPNDGFAGPPAITDRFPDSYQLDRLGSEKGGFLADDGAPLSTRGMPPGVASDYHQYVGTGQPIPDGLPWEIRYGPAKDAFGQPGGANQWVVIATNTGLPVPVNKLVDAGLIGRP